ncbi:MAG: tail fiber protein [Gammaproteobacteria bacterium]|nr:tail fiber protein [Gammaproteobacteria bacterium]
MRYLLTSKISKLLLSLCCAFLFSSGITWSPFAKAGISPYIGEITMFGGNFAPTGWALCNGQILDTEQNPALFSIIGATYGGNGRTTFALPDLQGRLPMHKGQGVGLTNRSIGAQGGAETVTLSSSEIPHSHSATSVLRASTTSGTTNAPAGTVLAEDGGDKIYEVVAPNVEMSASAITTTVGNSSIGGTQAHPNMQPYTVVNFIIAIIGVIPTQT